MTKRKTTAEGNMRGILMALDSNKTKPSPEFLASIKEMTVDAMAVLREPDEEKQKMGFIILAIQNSIEVSVRMINKKRIVRVKILNLDIYNYAMEEAYEFGREAA